MKITNYWLQPGTKHPSENRRNKRMSGSVSGDRKNPII